MKEIISNFIEIVTKKYFCFEGRAKRGEFWRYVLVYAVIGAILNAILPVLSGIWSLALLCPSLGVTARRLHDTDKSGWLQLLALIPIIGGIIVLVLCIPAGNPEANKYGA